MAVIIRCQAVVGATISIENSVKLTGILLMTGMLLTPSAYTSRECLGQREMESYGLSVACVIKGSMAFEVSFDFEYGLRQETW